MANKILVVDDDLNICELLKLYLENEGYTVFTANDGQEAVNTFQAKSPDLVLLDIMLPKMDGWQVCREIRKTSSAPIIMLTAKGETFDKVLGLELGADDYVVKPFDAKEVMARVKAVLRRTKGDAENQDNQKKIVVYDNLEINITNYEMKVKGVPVDTPPKELELIYHFASNPNRVYTRDQLLEHGSIGNKFITNIITDVCQLAEQFSGFEPITQFLQVKGSNVLIPKKVFHHMKEG